MSRIAMEVEVANEKYSARPPSLYVFRLCSIDRHAFQFRDVDYHRLGRTTSGL